MAWNLLKTNWQPDEIVTADDMNDIAENITTLRSPGGQITNFGGGSNFSTSSTVFVNVDPNPTPASNLFTAIVTSTGRPLLVTFAGAITHSSGTDTAVYFDMTIDGVIAGGDDGILRVTARSGGATNASFVYWLDGVSAAQHTIVMKWRTASGTVTMWTGDGTSGTDVHPQFAVREIM